jgi:SAM-dependent methyltransferase
MRRPTLATGAPVPSFFGQYVWDQTRGLYARPGTTGLEYSDGDDVEERLAQIVERARDRSVLSLELARAITDWPSRYHLSPLRANLLRPLAGLFRGTTLEVGAGCGALTRFAGECGGQVTAVEGSLRRASIASVRCRDLPNVTVVCDRFDAFPALTTYDVVTLVGVLEWASRYGSDAGAGAEHALLAKCRDLLAPDGCLVLAIENQLGLKYLAGFAEDHAGVPMFGIDDRYDAQTAITFGRGELVSRLHRAGFATVDLFVPLPDYKLPTSVISPRGLADPGWSSTLQSLLSASPVADPQPVPLPLFSLEQAWRVVARNGLVPDLANSFLVVAWPAPSTPGRVWDDSVLAFHYGHLRRPEFAREVLIRRVDEAIEVVRRPLGPLKSADGGQPVILDLSAEPFREGLVWSDEAGRLLNRAGWSIADLVEWSQPWIEAVATESDHRCLHLASILDGRFLDATPQNLVRQAGGRFVFFDLEWQPRMPIEFGYLLFRGLFHTIARYRSVALPAGEVPRRVLEVIEATATAAGFWLSSVDLRRYCELESTLQGWVTGLDTSGVVAMLEHWELPVRPSLTDLAATAAEADRLREARAEDARQRQARDAEMESLRSVGIALETRLASTRAELEARDADVGALRRDLEDERVRVVQLGEAIEAARRAEQASATRLGDEIDTARAERDEAVRRARHFEVTGDAERVRSTALEVELARTRRRLSAALRHREAEADALARQVAEERLRHEAAEQTLRDALAVLHADAAALEASRSWRLTGPLRGGAGVLRGIGRWTAALEWRARRLAYAGWARLRRIRHVRDVIAGSGLFDPAYYLANNPDVARLGLDPLLHFIRFGAAEGRRPHALFDPSWYRRQHAAVVPPGVNPLAHFLECGAADGLDPHPLFDTRFYRQQHDGSTTVGVNALVHYLSADPATAADPHPLFDGSFYLAHNPDVATAGLNPLVHYVAFGNRERRSPHPLFDSAFYLDAHPEVAERGLDPLVHFLAEGAALGFDPGPAFDVRAYVAANPDVARSGLNPLVHHVSTGTVDRRGQRPAVDAVTGAAGLAATAIERPVVLRLQNLGGPRAASRPLTRPVLCFTHVAPFPPAAGNEYRIHRLLKWVQGAGHDVVLVVAPLAGEEIDANRVMAMSREFPNVIVCERDGTVRHVLAHGDLLSGLDGSEVTPATDLPGERAGGEDTPPALDLERQFCHDVLIAVLRHLGARLGACVVLAQYVFMTRALPLLSQHAVTIVDTHDVFSSRREKVLRFGVTDLCLTEDDERRCLERADIVLAIQDGEREALSALVPSRVVVTAGVDFDVCDPGSPTGLDVLVVASGNAINVKGLRDFLCFAWPSIRRAVPGARLLVAGRVAELARTDDPQVEWLGVVPDTTALYRRARVAINPCAAGTGLKVKTVEALSRLRPVVAWPNGIDGLEPGLAARCLRAEDWFTFARQVVHVLTAGRDRWFDAGDEAVIRRALSSDRVYRDLAAVLAGSRRQAPPPAS